MELIDSETTARMESRLATWEAIGDGRRSFLDCYARMTRNMLAAIEEGRFEDPHWVSRLLHHFAGYYFDALEAFERDDDNVPAIWTHAYHAALESRTSALQSLLLGVNAHINYDLVFALADMLRQEWDAASESERAGRYRDHCLVNAIIGETVDEVQDLVVERHAPGMDIVDKALGPVDELVASWLISRWRQGVWDSAVELLACCGEDDLEALRRRVELNALERAHLLLLV